jgi:hypothetical protein
MMKWANRYWLGGTNTTVSHHGLLSDVRILAYYPTNIVLYSLRCSILISRWGASLGTRDAVLSSVPVCGALPARPEALHAFDRGLQPLGSIYTLLCRVFRSFYSLQPTFTKISGQVTECLTNA